MGIALPADFSTQVASSSSATILGLNPYTVLVLGVLLAALVITILIRAIARH